MQEIPVRFQFGVRLRHCHKTAHSAGQLCAGFHLPLCICRREIAAAGIGNRLQHRLFVGGIALHRFHQIGDQIKPLLEHHIDLAPLGLNL